MQRSCCQCTAFEVQTRIYIKIIQIKMKYEHVQKIWQYALSRRKKPEFQI